MVTEPVQNEANYINFNLSKLDINSKQLQQFEDTNFHKLPSKQFT